MPVSGASTPFFVTADVPFSLHHSQSESAIFSVKIGFACKFNRKIRNTPFDVVLKGQSDMSAPFF